MATKCQELLEPGLIASWRAARGQTRLKEEAPLKPAALFIAGTVFDSGCYSKMLRGV